MNYWVLAVSDIARTIQVMIEARASVAGVANPAVYTALCRDACSNQKHPRITIIVAEEESEIVGYVVAILSSRDYWRYFAQWHPWLAGTIVWRRATKLLQIPPDLVVKFQSIDIVDVIL
jgi:hypothetical protein